MASKIILANVPSSIDIEDLKLVFESPRIWGKCPCGYEIIASKEYQMDEITKLIVLEYSSIESVQCILNKGTINFRNVLYIPMGYKEEIINQLEKNRNETEIVADEDESRIAKENKINRENKQESLNFDLIEETQTAYVFKFKLIRHKFPFYLLEYNKNVLENLNEELRSLFSAYITETSNEIYLIQATFSKDKLSCERIISEYKNWSYHLNNFLNQHLNRCFSQYRIPINDRNLFIYMRYKTIGYYSKSDSISLIYKNDLNDFWIRIEGEAKLMEIERKKIEKDINFFNQNTFLMI